MFDYLITITITQLVIVTKIAHFSGEQKEGLQPALSLLLLGQPAQSLLLLGSSAQGSTSTVATFRDLRFSFSPSLSDSPVC